MDINERSFLVQILNYDNGNFVSVTEGSQNIGGMIVSINSGPVPSTSTIIPPKSEALFLKLVSDKIAYVRQGMSIVTGNFEKALEKEINVSKNIIVPAIHFDSRGIPHSLKNVWVARAVYLMIILNFTYLPDLSKRGNRVEPTHLIR